MAYKKYIKRGGKTYGPYIYHSKRIDGKVISEYRGPGKISYRKVFLAVFGVIFLVALIFILIFSEREMTGKAVIEFEREIEGQVSVNETFNYTLQEGERAELKPRSVKTDFEQLSDGDVELKTEENEVIITTTYSEINQSFGEEISPVVYFVLSILSEEESVEENTTELAPEPTLEPESEIPETDLTNEIEFEIEETEIYVPELIVSLTEQERAILIEEFGNASVEVKEATSKRGFMIIRYELGEYWAEFSYDSNLKTETMELFIDRDRTKWLKDIAKSLSEEPEIEPEFNESEIPI
jgi:hypothetical protein